MTSLCLSRMEIEAVQLAGRIRARKTLPLRPLPDKVDKAATVIVDCRCLHEFNESHVKHAVNAFYAKLMRRRLAENKLDQSVLLSQLLGAAADLLADKCGMVDLVLYADDNETTHMRHASKRRASSNDGHESSAKIIRLLRDKLEDAQVFRNIMLLKGGFGEFRAAYPELCEAAAQPPMSQPLPTLEQQQRLNVSSSLDQQHDRVIERDLAEAGCYRASSLSQPCMPRDGDNNGPTEILPFLYLGGLHDARDAAVLKKNNISHVINLTMNCPGTDMVESADCFMHIPVYDNYQEKLLPHFEKAYAFLEDVRKSNRIALIHCLAGISRSPTVAISYIMRHMKMNSDEAYKFVKARRPSISPNFNFMGQLLEYEKVLREEKILPKKDDESECERRREPVTEKDFVSPPKVPKSASSHVLFPTTACPASSLNENGKRAMEPPSALYGGGLDRPRALPGLTRRRDLFPADDLPSPSTELSKLSELSVDKELTAANPCFFSPPGLPGPGSAFPGPAPSMPSSVSMSFTSCERMPRVEEEPGSAVENPCFSRPATGHRTFAEKLTALFRKRQPATCGPVRSQTSPSLRPMSLADSGVPLPLPTRDSVARTQLSPVVGPSSATADEADSPESGFQEEYKATPDDAERASIGSTSSLEIAVQ